MIFFETLGRTRLILTFCLILFPPLLFGGIGATATFVIQAGTVITFFLYSTVLCFHSSGFLADPDRLTVSPNARNLITAASAMFLLFIIYAFLQWKGGLQVFSKSVPGSIGRYRTGDFLQQLVCYILFFFLAYDFASSKKRLEKLVFLLGLEVFFLIALGYYQEVSGWHEFNKMYGLFDMSRDSIFFSSFMNPNHYGGFLISTSFLFLAAVFHRLEVSEGDFELDVDFMKNSFFIILLPLISMSAFYVSARAAVILQPLLVLIFMCAAVSAKKRPKAFLGFLLLAAGACLLISFLTVGIFTQAYTRLAEEFKGRLFTINREAFGIARDFPIFGTGLGTFKLISGAYQVEGADGAAWLRAFNHYLELLTDTGVVGFALFLTPLFILVLVPLKKGLFNGCPWCRIFGLGSFVSLVFMAGVSFFDDYLRTPSIAVLFILLLAVFVRCAYFEASGASENASLDEAEGTGVSMDLKRLALWVLSAFILAVLLFRSCADYRASLILRKSGDDPGLMERSVRLRPEDPETWIKIGDAYYGMAVKNMEGDFTPAAKKSLEAYQRAVDLTPTLANAWTQLGCSKILLGRRIAGLHDMAHGVELTPYNRDAYLYLIQTCLRMMEYSPWEDEKSEFKKQALILLEKTRKLPRPLTKEDYNYNTSTGKLPSLSEHERKRLFSLLDELAASRRTLS